MTRNSNSRPLSCFFIVRYTEGFERAVVDTPSVRIGYEETLFGFIQFDPVLELVEEATWPVSDNLLDSQTLLSRLRSHLARVNHHEALIFSTSRVTMDRATPRPST